MLKKNPTAEKKKKIRHTTHRILLLSISFLFGFLLSQTYSY